MSTAYNPAKHHKHSELLYKILPQVYRERDKKNDLEKYLNGSGILLDQIHRTLLQRYADIFPDTDEAFDIDSQTWLLPYIAALLDARIISPIEQGQREEIANAISWRKAKGTLSVVEQVAEAVGGLEVVVHEGWRRVAVTARIGLPVLPLDSYGYMGNENYENDFQNYQNFQSPDLAPMWARHPALPAGTVDFRCQGSAVEADEDNPAAVTSHVAGKSYRWRQSSLHGSQNCNKDHSILPVSGKQTDWIPGYFDDPSVRTVDFRNPDWRKGHFHPRQVLLFVATHPGFFETVSEDREFSWDENLKDDESFLALVSVEIIENKTIYRNKTLDENVFKPIVMQQRVELAQVPSGTGPVDPDVWRFEGFVFSHTIEVDSGRLELEQCAVLAAEVHSIDLELPVLIINNCLCNRVQAARGLVQMQYSTVLTTAIAEKLNASDCIFNGQIRKHHDEVSLPGKGCIRYSAIMPEQDEGELKLFKTHFQEAVFYSINYGDAGCGVLHPATDLNISNGAEDGGEMGAYHHLFLVARHDAVIKKLDDFLPTGMKAVVIPDGSLHDLPGEIEE
jgi:hypothetical protein